MTDGKINIILIYWPDPSASIDSFLSKTAVIMLFPCSVQQATCRKDCCLPSPFSQESELKLRIIHTTKTIEGFYYV